MSAGQPSTRRIFAFFAPLASTWLMMAFEGPFLAAVIARQADAESNLAAYGVAYAFALILEAPVIMLLSASTQLARDRPRFLALKRFMWVLAAVTTAATAALCLPAVHSFVTGTLLGLPLRVADLVLPTLVLLLPWAGAIAYRRFYQGVMIRAGHTPAVAAGTALRVVAMASTALSLARWSALPGAALGGAALSAGVMAEAAASRWMARPALRRLDPSAEGAVPGLRRILRFYLPLALTTLLSLGVQPLVTFFLGRSREAVASLAVFPVVLGLVFIFRSLGLAYQDVVIAMAGEDLRHARSLRRFATWLAAVASGLLSLAAIPVIGRLWFGAVSGLPEHLVLLALVPTMILAPMPALSVAFSFQRALAVKLDRTSAIGRATALEVSVIAVCLAVTILGFDLVGAVAAAGSLLAGRLVSVAWLGRRLGPRAGHRAVG